MNDTTHRKHNGGMMRRSASWARARKKSLGVAAGVLLAGVAACTYNPDLGRNQLLLGDPSNVAAAANQAWTQLKTELPVSTNARYNSRLDRVAPKLITAMGDNPANWEYLVFDSDDLNAFALPDKKIGMYTGIMDIMQNDAQLAAVIGHEIAHVNYNHAQERQAQRTIGSVGAIAAGAAIGAAACDTGNCQNRAIQGATLGTTALFLLPHSRNHELEADVGGLKLMAQAGYNPCEAIDFWRNMQGASEGQGRPPEFLSTHPGPENRIATLRRAATDLGYSCS